MKSKLCAICNQPTRGKGGWIEAVGVRICLPCFHKRAEELRAKAKLGGPK